MILFVLGILDLWVALFLWVVQFGMQDYVMVLFHSVYLFVKGIAFWGELYSIIDVVIALYLLLMVFGISHWMLTLGFSLFLLQKAFFSLRP